MKSKDANSTTTSKVNKSYKVACLTTDFAMQNVMLSMGMKVISVEGMMVRKTRQFVLRCFGCYTICTDMERAFCPACGNNTLVRVSKVIDGNGTVSYSQNFNKRLTTKRGTIYSIPSYKGGRRAHNIILNEESYIKALQTRRKAREPLDPDVDAVLGIKKQTKNIVVGYGGKNPNVSRKRIGKKNRSVLVG